MKSICYEFLGNVFIRGIIRCENPVHIGGSYQEYSIGGMDNPIIREPKSGHPYIPGSSLRGKMRSMLEWAEGKVKLNDDGNAPHHTCSGLEDTEHPRLCPICLVFGSPASKELAGKRLVGPTRLIIRDAYLTECWERKLEDLRRTRGIPFAEQKMENAIDRITAVANPRPMERTIRGTEFDFEMVYQVFIIPKVAWLKKIHEQLQKNPQDNAPEVPTDQDAGVEEAETQDTEPQETEAQNASNQTQYSYDGGRASIEHLRYVFAGMELVQDTYLGGGGSRGSGKVEFLLYATPEIRTRGDYLLETEETELDGGPTGEQANSTSTDGETANEAHSSPPAGQSELANSGDQENTNPADEPVDDEVSPNPLSEIDIDDYIKYVLVAFGLKDEEGGNGGEGDGDSSSETDPQNGISE